MEAMKDLLRRRPWAGFAAAASITGLAVLSLALAPAAEAQEGPAETEERAEPERPAPPRPRPPADDVFIPSEEIAADEEVTFPVDI
jgi:hypothetical protein